MRKYVVAVVQDAPNYWSALFNDGSTEQLDATIYSDAVTEADLRFGVATTQQFELEEDIG